MGGQRDYRWGDNGITDSHSRRNRIGITDPHSRRNRPPDRTGRDRDYWWYHPVEEKNKACPSRRAECHRHDQFCNLGCQPQDQSHNLRKSAVGTTHIYQRQWCAIDWAVMPVINTNIMKKHLNFSVYFYPSNGDSSRFSRRLVSDIYGSCLRHLSWRRLLQSRGCAFAIAQASPRVTRCIVPTALTITLEN